MMPTKLKLNTIGTTTRLTTELEGKGRSVNLSFNIYQPVKLVEGHPVFEINGSFKTIIHHAIPEPSFYETRSVKDLTIRTPKEIYIDIIRRAFAKGASNLDSSNMAQKVVDSFFGTSELIRVVAPHKPLDQESGALTIYIDSIPSSHWEDYRLKDWAGSIDLITTPQGEKIGHTFKLAKDARIESGKIVPSKNLFSNIMRSCIIFPENTRPNRLLISRPAFTNHEALVYSEQPLVTHKSYLGNFKGRHLITAIASDPENYQDALVISQACASKLMCHIHKAIVFQDTKEITPCVEVGDVITTGSKVIKIGTGKEALFVHNTFAGSDSWFVEDITIGDTMVGGVKGTKIRVDISSIYECRDGDKLTTRHGGKGVVRIRPNNLMPKVNGVPVDILVHPMSFNSRRNLGTFREMMFNKKYWNDFVDRSKPLKLIEHFGDVDTMAQLVEEGFGDAITFDDGTMAFVAPLYWIRTNHHAVEGSNLVQHAAKPNKNGLKPDSSALSGKRMSINYATILHAQGMQNVTRKLLQDNVQPQTLSKIHDLLNSLA